MSKNLARANEWLLQLVEGELGHELENITLANLKTLKAHEGYILCSYIIPEKLAVNFFPSYFLLFSCLYDQDV